MPAPRDPASSRSRYNGRRSRGTIGPLNAVIELPATGCELPVPPLPSGRDWTPAERARWRELWRSPAANQWDESARGTVAAVVIYESQVMAGTASAWSAMELRHASESLGLTPKAMVTLGWRIVDGRS